MEKPKYYVVSFSGGKDSTAMLLHMLELGERIDEVICCDTYKEYPEMYVHIEKIKKVVESQGVKFTTLRAERSFDEYMFEFIPSDTFTGIDIIPKVRWANEPKVISGMVHQVSILRGIGVMISA